MLILDKRINLKGVKTMEKADLNKSLISDQDKARIAKREYDRNWRKNNSDRKKVYNTRYWVKKFDQMVNDQG